jgi:hypothetical protein
METAPVEKNNGEER